MTDDPIVWLTIFVLSVFVGIEVISKVSSTLHTPLMSGANAIHGIILVGAIGVAGHADSTPILVLSLVAVVLALWLLVMGLSIFRLGVVPAHERQPLRRLEPGRVEQPEQPQVLGRHHRLDPVDLQGTEVREELRHQRMADAIFPVLWRDQPAPRPAN